jgi:RNA polymerase sigma-70 factor (ECF subfamily)
LKKNANRIIPSEVSSDLSFGSFYNTYYKRFVRYASYYVSNRQTAEDITHDAILYYWECKDILSSDTDVLGYILLTVRNKCLNHLKHLQVEADYNKQHTGLHEWEINARIMTLEDTHYAEIFKKEIISIVTAALTKLPEQTRLIFIQNRMNYMSRKEIAADLGVSLQKIDYHINKANDYLHKELKDYFPLLVIFMQKFFY